MKALKTLIKLHKNQIDNITKEISTLENKQNKIMQTLASLQNQMILQAKQYTGTEYAFILDKYLKNAEKDKNLFIEEISQIEQQLVNLRTHLNEEFAELKKFEIVMQNRIREAMIAEAKAETKILDEFNATKFNLDNKSERE